MSESDVETLVDTEGAEPVTEDMITDANRELMESADARQVLHGRGRGSKLGSRRGITRGKTDTDLETDQQEGFGFLFISF